MRIYAQSNGHQQQLLRFTFAAPAPTPSSNSPRFHTRATINTRFTPGLPTLCLFSLSSSNPTLFFSLGTLPSIFPSTFTSRTYTERSSSPQQCTRFLCLGNRRRNRSIWHATRSKCSCRRTELRSAQRAFVLLPVWFNNLILISFLLAWRSHTR